MASEIEIDPSSVQLPTDADIDPASVQPPKAPARADIFGAPPAERKRASRMESLAQGVEQGGSFGFGDEAQAALDTAVSKVPGLRYLAEKSRGFVARHLPGSEHLPVDDPNLTYAQRRDFFRSLAHKGATDNPGTYFGGTLAGGLLNTPALVAGGGIPAAAANGIAAGSASALGSSEADLTKGDAVGALRDTVEGGAAGGLFGLLGGVTGRAIGNASERVAKRIPEDVIAGETKARQSIARRVQARAGEEGEGLAGTMARHPEIETALATTAKGAPKKALKTVEAKTEELTGRLNEMYEQMDKAGRAVSPTDIAIEFDKMVGAARNDGQLDRMNVLKKARAMFLDEYGNNGKLSAKQLRGLKQTAAKAAFAGDPTADPTMKAQVSRDIWRTFASAIEQRAEKVPGLDPTELRAVNTDLANLIPVEHALRDRSLKEGAGVWSLSEMGRHAGTMAAGAALGGIHGGTPEAAILGLLAPPAAKAAAAAARVADLGLARAQARLANGGSGAQYVGELMRTGIPFGAAIQAAQAAGRDIAEENQ